MGFQIDNGVLVKYTEDPGITDITMPDGVTSIGNSAFKWCGSLRSIKIPDSVTSIGDSAFEWCSSLRSVIIPDGVTRIEDRAFKKCSDLTSITIPNSVTNIGKSAFEDCSNLVSIVIPDSVTSIEEWAFCDCRNLMSITMPNKVTSIKNYTFSGCSSLTSIKIPDGVTSIADSAFSLCISLSNIKIPDSVMSIGDSAFSCCRSLTSITIPDSVTSIGNMAFSGCSNVTSIKIPDGVTSIGDRAFSVCSSLTSITISDSVTSIGKDAFQDCYNLSDIRISDSAETVNSAFLNYAESCKILIPEKRLIKLMGSSFTGNYTVFAQDGTKVKILIYAYRQENNNLAWLAEPDGWRKYDTDLVNNGPAFNYSLHDRLLGGCDRLLNPDNLANDLKEEYRAFLYRNRKKVLAIAEDMRSPEIIRMMIEEVVPADKMNAFVKLIKASSVAEIAALADELPQMETKAPIKAKPPVDNDPLSVEYTERYKAIKGNTLLRKAKLSLSIIPEMKLKNGEKAPESIFKYLLAGEMSLLDYEYDANYNALQADERDLEEAAELLDHDSLLEAVEKFAETYDCWSMSKIIPFLCRYGSEKVMKNLIAQVPLWKDWHSDKGGMRGRTAAERFDQSYMLSNTNAAAKYAHKNGEIYRYIRAKGTSIDRIYTQVLNCGLDEAGGMAYDLGNVTVTARLQEDLSFLIEVPGKDKPMKSLPKKGADLDKYESAKQDLSELKKTVRETARNEKNNLFSLFLGGSAIDSQSWLHAYTTNPIMRHLAKRIVWSQLGQTFIWTDDGAVGADGKPYELRRPEVKVAHPVEMDQAEINAWKEYISAHDIKQPFVQIWEIPHETKDIKPTRYEGYKVYWRNLQHMEKHGISFDYDRGAISLSGWFEIGSRLDDNGGDVILGRLSGYNNQNTRKRQFSHIISIFDKWVIEARIADDDITILEDMDNYDAAQITEFIDIAAKNKAVQVSAALLEYKNKKFPNYDAFAEFTLE